MKDLSDEKLCELSQQKNAEATVILIERYKHMVSSIAHGYFLTDGDLEDLIQVGTIAVFKAICSYKNKAEFKNYAFKCVKNAILTAVKKSNSNKNKPLINYISFSGFSDGDSDRTILMADDSCDPEESYINFESEVELKQKIKGSLSKYENQILSLYLQGYSYTEIGLQLNKSSKSIDNALQRIKRKILIYK